MFLTLEYGKLVSGKFKADALGAVDNDQEVKWASFSCPSFLPYLVRVTDGVFWHL